MCGIVAVVTPNGSVADIDATAALATLHRRGPDGDGLWRSSCNRVLLGHTRLAIVGDRDDVQPFHNEDGSVTAVINGEIYDHQRLRRQLLERGHRLRSHCDSELLVHLYEEYGERIFDMLRGQWALALHDRARQRVLIARDRHGIKPIYYSEQQGNLYAASSATALFALGLAARLEPENCYIALSLHYPPQGKTLYDKICVLPAGHALRITSTGVQQWRWAKPISASEHISEPAHIAEQFLGRFDEAVRLRAQHDGPIAIQLSGGIDSTAVLASAAPLAQHSMTAVSVSFPGCPEDELDNARAAAAHVGASLLPVLATPERLAAIWPQAVAAGQGLAINAHLPAKWLLAEAVASAGIRVVLTGEGADEVLYGYPHLRLDAGVDPTQLVGEQAPSLGLMLADGAGLNLDATERRLGFVPAFLRAKACIGARVRPLLRRDFVAAMSFQPDERLLDSLRIDSNSEPRVDRAAQAWRQLALEGYILRTLGDGMEMAHSVEGRLPFLDGPLSCWLDSLSWRDKIAHGVDKAPLRRAMQKRLPRAITQRPKHPFVAPPLAGPLLDVAADALSSRAFRDLPIVNVDAALAVIRSLPQLGARERKQLDPALWLLASLAMLSARFSLSLAG